MNRTFFSIRPILRSLLVALCAGDPDLLGRVDLERVAERVETHVAELPGLMRFGFRSVLLAIEFALPPVAWKWRRFSRLSMERQLDYLTGWEQSPMPLKRNGFKLIKAICVCNLFSEPALLESLGYGPAMRHRMEARGTQPCIAPRGTP